MEQYLINLKKIIKKQNLFLINNLLKLIDELLILKELNVK